jgi:hypothetical protein
MIRDDPHERLEFYRPAALPGVELMAAYEASRAGLLEAVAPELFFHGRRKS